MATRRPSMAAEGLRMGAIWLSRARSMRRGGGVEGGLVVVCGRHAGSRDAARPEMRLLAGRGVGRGSLSVGGRGPRAAWNVLATREAPLGGPRPSAGQIRNNRTSITHTSRHARARQNALWRTRHSQDSPARSTASPDSPYHRCVQSARRKGPYRPRSRPFPLPAVAAQARIWPS